MTDIMLDIETFGNGPNAMIVQFAAVKFDRNTGEALELLKRNIDPKTDKFGVMDADTVLFWMRQEDAARNSVTAKGIDAKEAFYELNHFLRNAKCIWSHATFDFPIVTNKMVQYFGYPFYHYRSSRDIRTLVDLAGIDPKSYPKVGTAHDAMSDCLFQITYCVDALKKLRSNTQ